MESYALTYFQKVCFHNYLLSVILWYVRYYIWHIIIYNYVFINLLVASHIGCVLLCATHMLFIMFKLKTTSSLFLNERTTSNLVESNEFCYWFVSPVCSCQINFFLTFQQLSTHDNRDLVSDIHKIGSDAKRIKDVYDINSVAFLLDSTSKRLIVVLLKLFIQTTIYRLQWTPVNGIKLTCSYCIDQVPPKINMMQNNQFLYGSKIDLVNYKFIKRVC